MATRLSTYLHDARDRTRYEPTAKRVRGFVGQELVVDSRAVRLVWEPRRALCEYAVPAADLAGWVPSEDTASRVAPPEGDGPILPTVPFAAHTARGTPLDLRVGDRVVPGAGFALEEDGLEGYVVVDFDAVDGWREEDEAVVGHPRDPFHRVDVRRSTTTVVVRDGDAELARTSRPAVVFETGYPARYYLPSADVRTDLLTPTSRTVLCAYKGAATYLAHGDRADVAWGYESPLPDATGIADHWCFDDSVVQVSVEDWPDET